MSCRLFSDFHCPFSYAMHERLHDLGLMAQISWHGVQHARHSPVPMQTWSGHLASELKQEVEMVRRLVPELSIALPLGKPNSAVVRPLPRQPARSALTGYWLKSLSGLCISCSGSAGKTFPVNSCCRTRLNGTGSRRPRFAARPPCP